MEFDAFEALAEEMWESIPPHYKAGVNAVVVDPDPRPDPDLPESLLLGECRVDPALQMAVDVQVESIISIYHGSFVEVAKQSEDFDWEGELWETLTHELRHHLEWRAGHDALGHEDDLQKENILRLQGKRFARTFYRHGQVLEARLYVVHGEAFFEVDVRPRDWHRVFEKAVHIFWRGWRVVAGPAPKEERGEKLVYVLVDDLWEEEEHADERALDWEDVSVVFRRKRRLWWTRRAPFELSWEEPEERPDPMGEPPTEGDSQRECARSGPAHRRGGSLGRPGPKRS